MNKMDKKKKIMLSVGVLVIVLVIGIVLFLIFNKKEDVDMGSPADLNPIDTTILPTEEVKKDLEEAKKGNKKLLFTIAYSTEKCPSPYLYVYNDNTYEYYDTLDKENLPEAKVGTIDYDLVKLGESLKEYTNEGPSAYSVRYNDLIYVTSTLNEEMKAFLESIDVVLEKCIVEK